MRTRPTSLLIVAIAMFAIAATTTVRHLEADRVPARADLPDRRSGHARTAQTDVAARSAPADTLPGAAGSRAPTSTPAVDAATERAVRAAPKPKSDGGAASSLASGRSDGGAGASAEGPTERKADDSSGGPDDATRPVAARAAGPERNATLRDGDIYLLQPNTGSGQPLTPGSLPRDDFRIVNRSGGAYSIGFHDCADGAVLVDGQPVRAGDYVPVRDQIQVQLRGPVELHYLPEWRPVPERPPGGNG